MLNPKKNYIELFYYNDDELKIKDIIAIRSNNKFYKDYYFNLLDNYFKKSVFSKTDFFPEFIIIRSMYGGTVFTGPVICNDSVIKKLNKMINNSPMQINLLTELIRISGKIFHSVPVVLFFETSFFHKLPNYEKLYAIDQNISRNNKFFRYGFHGLFHEACVNYIYETEKIDKTNNKILSVYLDKNPEIVAVKNKKPVMVTSGATPLEGLLGEKKCGRLDPSIVFMLIKEFKIGLEKINYILTQESGLYGLTGEKITFPDLYDKKLNFESARKVFEYNMILEIGSGISAMSGADYIIFSGNYSGIGKYITNNINDFLIDINKNLKIYYYNDSIDEAVLKLFNYYYLKNGLLI